MMRWIVWPCLFAVLFVPPVRGAVQIVSSFGANGWYSWDTRNVSGTHLAGTNDTSPIWPGAHTQADDVSIEKQIKFLGENQIVADSSGGTPDPSPTGSLNSLGYVRLDGTSSNDGKSDISYVSSSPITPATDLTAGSFGTGYSYYVDSNSSGQALAFNVGTVDSVDPSKVFTLSHVEVFTPDTWNIAVVNNGIGPDTGGSLFSLHGQGAPGDSISKTLIDWFADATWGPQLQDDNIFRVGFNIGTGQPNSLIYVDWLATTLINGGDAIDFQETPVPEASSWALCVTAAGLGGLLRLNGRRQGFLHRHW